MDINQLRELTKQYRRKPLISIQELGTFVFHHSFMCFMQETEHKLHSISTYELQMKWAEIKKHITLEDSAYLEDFPDGYCYFVDAWVNDAGEYLLLLKKSH